MQSRRASKEVFIVLLLDGFCRIVCGGSRPCPADIGRCRTSDHIWFTLLGGYSYHELNLIVTDGVQTIPATGSFAGLHSSYWAEWDGANGLGLNWRA